MMGGAEMDGFENGIATSTRKEKYHVLQELVAVFRVRMMD
jgi:hypothetical protein